MKTPPITQSLIKHLAEYHQGLECGLTFEYCFIEGNYFPPSEAMMLGIYFEYVAFGTLPKDGRIPKGKFKKGKKGVNPELADLQKKYDIMFRQAANLRSYMKDYGFKILSAGEKITTTLDSGIVVQGTTDLKLLLEKDVLIYNHSTQLKTKILPAGTIVQADTKTSGLMGERGKWAELGWHLDFLEGKHKIMVQPLHYTFIEWKNTGEVLPFLFFVHSQANDKDALFVEVEIDPQKFIDHENIIEATHTMLTHYMKVGFKAIPEFERCGSCPLQENCPSKEVKPKIYSIYY